MRRKIEESKKKRSIGITIHKDLLSLLDLYSDEINSNRSEIIENLLKKHFNKE